MRDRAWHHFANSSQQQERPCSDDDSDAELGDDLIRLAKQHGGEIYPLMLKIMGHYRQILQRDVET